MAMVRGEAVLTPNTNHVHVRYDCSKRFCEFNAHHLPLGRGSSADLASHLIALLLQLSDANASAVRYGWW